MPSPFPGMDPFLEHPAIFPDLHDSLIAAMREALNAELKPPYYAGIGTRVWVEASERRIGPDVKVIKGRNGEPAAPSSNGGVAVATASTVTPVLVRVPSEEIREPFLEIYAAPGGERLVTTIEILSLANKTAGSHGRPEYLRKQREILESQVNLIEIDLLRAGLHTTAVPHANAVADVGDFDYHVCVHRFDTPGDYMVYPVRLPQRLPAITVPLLPEDGAVTVNLQSLLNRCYEGGRYERRVRYDRMRLVPPVREASQEWLAGVLAVESP